MVVESLFLIRLNFLQGGDIEKATDWIFNNPDASTSSDMDAATSSTAQTPADAGLPDGGGSKFLKHILAYFIPNLYMLSVLHASFANNHCEILDYVLTILAVALLCVRYLPYWKVCLLLLLH